MPDPGPQSSKAA